MKEHPILFSTEMVRAILEGRKTQTRRVVKPQPPKKECNYIGQTVAIPSNKLEYYWSDGVGGDNQGFWPNFHDGLPCPYGQHGDWLWVRETFTEWPKGEFQFKASTDTGDELGKWKPSIHMPKAAARIWLEITDVGVERVQDITYADAKAEGVEYPHDFYQLWKSINGYKSWLANPWVWVVSFKVLSTTGKPEQP